MGAEGNGMSVTALPEKVKSELITEVNQLDKRVNGLKVVDDKSSQEATIVLKSVTEMKKRVTEKRNAIVKPIQESVKLIDAEFKKILEPLGKCESLVRAGMGEYFKKKERERIEAENKARAEALRKEKELSKELRSKNDLIRENAEQELMGATAKAEAKVPEKIKSVSTNVGMVTSRKEWKFSIINIDNIPEELLKPREVDSSKVKAAIKLGRKQIPGLRIWEDVITIVR